jgi:DNA (cytosine-5)-methyltransferase 1
MNFIDLFAGLGGFHLALRELGHTCVFASEIDETLRETYKKNFKIEVAGDIRQVKPGDIPQHDIICAGFPCQPFSKAGSQKGFGYPGLGTLYGEIIKIIKYHHPKYIILENVPNFQNHKNGKTWETLESLLVAEGYGINIRKLSPHDFGIPQIRERIYIVGVKGGLGGFVWPTGSSKKNEISIKTILDKKPRNATPISPKVKKCLNIWQEFLDQLPADEQIPLPLWSMEFGATYPYENGNPLKLKLGELQKFRGNHGVSLKPAKTRDSALELLPSYAKNEENEFPDWKKNFIRKNREFYTKHKSWLDLWKTHIIEFPASFQKFEWNCYGEKSRKINRYLIQIRPSGVRVKRPTTAPSLVAMTTTQVPIIGWEKRYMTPTECKRLQSMQKLKYMPESNNKAYEALGNAVNVDVVKRIAEALIKSV